MKINRNKWRPVTIAELREMSDEDKAKLWSVAWDEYNKFRCDTIGITNVKISEPRHSVVYGSNVVDIEWSDNDGDPRLWGYPLDAEIDRISGIEDYRYGLYIKIK